jgi:membrane associated rhomboid family serine protease
MPVFTKTEWTKIRDDFESSKGPPSTSNTAAGASVPPPASRTYALNGDVIMEIDGQGSNIHATPPADESHRPLFTVGVAAFDVLMLIIMYIVQRGTSLTSETWIKMGGKYVPCMRPLSSKAERLVYDAGLKSQCHAFLFPYQIYRFFMPMFLHGGVTHLLSNLVYQALAGSLLERKYGTKTFAICYILFGFSGNVMSALLKPKSGM